MRAARKKVGGHHSDRSAQSVSLRTTPRLKEAGIAPSVRSTGDSYANALAETIIGLNQAAVRHRHAWSSLTQGVLATKNWLHRDTHQGELGAVG